MQLLSKTSSKQQLQDLATYCSKIHAKKVKREAYSFSWRTLWTTLSILTVKTVKIYNWLEHIATLFTYLHYHATPSSSSFKWGAEGPDTSWSNCLSDISFLATPGHFMCPSTWEIAGWSGPGSQSPSLCTWASHSLLCLSFSHYPHLPQGCWSMVATKWLQNKPMLSNWGRDITHTHKTSENYDALLLSMRERTACGLKKSWNSESGDHEVVVLEVGQLAWLACCSLLSSSSLLFFILQNMDRCVWGFFFFFGQHVFRSNNVWVRYRWRRPCLGCSKA